MSLRSPQASASVSGGALAYLGAVLRCLWIGARFPILALLAILAPVVRVLLGGAALLLVLTALFLQAVAPRAIPFWGMIATAVGCVALIALYHAIVRVLSA